MQQNNLPSHPPPPFARPDCVGVGPPDCRLNDCALVLDPYAGGAPLLAAVTCVMTLAAFGIGAASEPPAPPPEYEPPPSSPSPSRVHIVRPIILVGDPGVRGAGGMEGRSSSRSTSSAWNAGFVGVDCGSVVIVGTDDPIRSVHSASTSVPARDDSASDSTHPLKSVEQPSSTTNPACHNNLGGDDDALCYGGEHSTRSPRRRARAYHRIDRSPRHPSSRRAPPPPSRPPRGLLNDVDAIIEDPHPRCIPSR